MRPFRAVITFIGFLLLVLFVWEGLKVLGGDPWRAEGRVIWNPPLRIFFASDLNLPHVWTIVAVLGQPAQRNSPLSLAQFLAGAAASTWREAAIGFVAGAILGLVLAIVFVESEFAERAFVPYVIASQTIPILALSPMIVQAFGQSTVSVAIVATYLTFFPMTIAGIRGLRSPDPRALELMQSYAASRWTVLWKVRFPASLPYLFTALKIAAGAALVGAIIGEGSGSFPEGLGRAIVNFNEQYITFPAKLWAAILVSALVGLAFYGIVRVAEYAALRDRPRVSE
jgi:NitT/TauT family transport system permease protein